MDLANFTAIPHRVKIVTKRNNYILSLQPFRKVVEDLFEEHQVQALSHK